MEGEGDIPSTLSALFNDKLLPIALEIGMDVFYFWNLTLAEITETFKANKRKEERRLKEQARANYDLAYMTASFVSGALAGNSPPAISSIYPKLFEEQQHNDNVWQFHKETMIDFAERHNKLRHQKEGDKIDDRRTESEDQRGHSGLEEPAKENANGT